MTGFHSDLLVGVMPGVVVGCNVNGLRFCDVRLKIGFIGVSFQNSTFNFIFCLEYCKFDWIIRIDSNLIRSELNLIRLYKFNLIIFKVKFESNAIFTFLF